MGKHVLSNNIAVDVRQPYTKVTHEWYNAMIDEAVNALGKGLVGTNSNFVVLYGCVNSASPNANITAGAIFYNGEIYLCPAFVDGAITNAIVGTITTAYDALDPVLFSDGNSYSVHQVKTIVWSDATAGTGDIDFANLAYQSGTIKRVVQLGDWNMDSTAGITVTTGLTATEVLKVVGAQVIIRDDSNTSRVPLDNFNGAVVNGGFDGTIGFTCAISRLAGGFFDNTSYDSTSYNRGFLVIEIAL